MYKSVLLAFFFLGMASNTTEQETTKMEICEERPNGRIKILASGDMFHWGVDRNGIVWQKWGNEKWKRALNKKDEQTCCSDYLKLNEDK